MALQIGGGPFLNGRRYFSHPGIAGRGVPDLKNQHTRHQQAKNPQPEREVNTLVEEEIGHSQGK